MGSAHVSQAGKETPCTCRISRVRKSNVQLTGYVIKLGMLTLPDNTSLYVNCSAGSKLNYLVEIMLILQT